MRNLAVLAVLFGALQSLPALAQAPLTQPAAQASAGPAPGKFAAPPCDGDVANVRLTEIIPGGTMEGYLQAVDAHRAWYRAHGYKNNEIFVARLMVEDPTTHQLTYSKTRVLAFHIRPPFMGGSTGHDAGWDNFHDLYRKNSNIVTAYDICIPKTPISGAR
jgi:hypothetical protein